MEALHRVEDLPEEGDEAKFLVRGWSFEAGVSFVDEETGDEDCAAEGEACYYAKDLELRVSKVAS